MRIEQDRLVHANNGSPKFWTITLTEDRSVKTVGTLLATTLFPYTLVVQYGREGSAGTTQILDTFVNYGDALSEFYRRSQAKIRSGYTRKPDLTEKEMQELKDSIVDRLIEMIESV